MCVLFSYKCFLNTRKALSKHVLHVVFSFENQIYFQVILVTVNLDFKTKILF